LSPPLSPPLSTPLPRSRLMSVREDDSELMCLPSRDANARNDLRLRRRSREHVVGISTNGSGREGPMSVCTDANNIHRPVLASLSSHTASNFRNNSGMLPTDADMILPLLSPMAPSAAAQQSLSPDWLYLPHQPRSLSGIVSTNPLALAYSTQAFQLLTAPR
jgi:hypothetical protein